ncbi:MAG TPA: hypothetical protein VGM66_12825 [Candidatus Udaeobacter sp.]
MPASAMTSVIDRPYPQPTPETDEVKTLKTGARLIAGALPVAPYLLRRRMLQL